MVDTLTVQCPNCDTELKVRAEYVGRFVSCNHCDQVFKIVRPGDSLGAPVVNLSPHGDVPDRPALRDLAERLERENAAMRDVLDAQRRLSNEERVEFRADLTRLAAELTEVRGKHEAEIARLKAEAESAGQDREARGEAARAEIDALKARLDAEREAGAGWQARWSETRAEADDLRTRLDEALAGRQAECAAFEEERVRLGNENDALSGELRALRGDLQAARADLARLADGLAARGAELASLTECLDEATRSAGCAATERDEARAALVREQTARRDEVRAYEDEASEHLSRRDRERATTAAAADEHRRAIEAVETKLRDATDLVASLSREAGDARAARDRFLSGAAAADAERGKLETELAARGARIDELQASLRLSNSARNQINNYLENMGIRFPV